MKKRHSTRKKKTFHLVKARITRFLLIVGALTTVSVIGFGAWQLRGVFDPISAEASAQGATLNLENNTLLLSFTDSKKQIQQIHIVGLNTKERTLREMVIPGQTLAILPLGLEEYQVKHIFQVLPQENNLEILQQALQNIAGTISDGIVVVQSDSMPQNAIDWLTNPINIGQVAVHPSWVGEHLQSSLTRAQLVQYMWNVSRIKPYNKRIHYVADSYIKESVQLKDNTQVLRIDTVKGDILTKELFEKVPLVKERIPIRIVNATNVNGLASHVERLLSNAGANVVETDTAPELSPDSKVILHQPTLQDSYTNEIIHHVLYVPAPTELSEGQFHYQISIILGEDYANFMKGE